jgi:rhodanese-related sulfurtransferase
VAIDSTQLEITFITPEHLKARLDAGEYLCLLDAREIAEFDTAHIPGAQWCSSGLLASHIERAAPTLYVPLVVYCSLDYTHIFVIAGGFLAWCAAGFPTETGCIDPLTSV